MTCTICEKNKASIHLEELSVHGMKKSAYLCNECYSEIEMSLLLDGIMQEAIGKIFTKTFSQLGIHGHPHSKRHKCKFVCESCGTSFDELKKTGDLGCAACYKAFTTPLEQIFEDTHGRTKHIGRIPKRGGAIVKRDRQVDLLREHMQKAVDDEDFSRAAFLRDQIKRLDETNNTH